MKPVVCFFCMLAFYVGGLYAQPRIFNGTNASQNEFPFHAVLADSNSYFCGGALIAPQWVLTAAHCLSQISPPLIITLNTNSAIANPLPSGHQVRSGIEFYIHPGYDENTLENDIALIKLATTSNLPVVMLPEQGSDTNVTVGETNIIIGAGLDENGNDGILKKAVVTVIDNFFDIIGFEGLPSSCFGDSGSPSLKQVGGSGSGYMQTGVASFGDADCNLYSGYTKVSSHRDWIDATMGVLPVSVKNIPFKPASLKVYYDAASQHLHIVKQHPVAVAIYDVQGKAVAVNVQDATVNLGYLQSGMYCVVASSGEIVKFWKY